MLLLIISTTTYIDPNSNALALLLPYFTFPAIHIASTASTIMTVALAHERYLAVQAPIVYSQMLRRASAQRRRLAMHVLPVLLFAVFFNMPTFWCVENICLRFGQPTPNETTSLELNNETTLVMKEHLLSEPDQSSKSNQFLNTRGNDAFFKDGISSEIAMEVPYSTVPLIDNHVYRENEDFSYHIIEQTTLKQDWNEIKTTQKLNLFSVAVTEGNLTSRNISDTKIPPQQMDENCEIISYRFTKFRKHRYFIMFYQNLARLVVLGMIPFATLIFFNCSIYLAIKRRRGKK